MMLRLAILVVLVSVIPVFSGSVPGFDVKNDSPYFSNFTLEDMKYWKRLEQFDQKFSPCEEEDFNIELEKLFNEIPDDWFTLNSKPYVHDKAGEKSAILDAFGYAHCWGMSHMTKMFFEHASYTSAREHSVVEQIRDIGDGYNRRVNAANLNEFSRQYEDELKKVVAEWQSKLLFNPFNLPFLFMGNQYKEFKKIRSSINSQELTLIQIKKSMSWMHVVLGYKTEGNVIWVYDCNYPGSSNAKLTYYSNSEQFYSAQYGDCEVNFLSN